MCLYFDCALFGSKTQVYFQCYLCLSFIFPRLSLKFGVCGFDSSLLTRVSWRRSAAVTRIIIFQWRLQREPRLQRSAKVCNFLARLNLNEINKPLHILVTKIFYIFHSFISLFCYETFWYKGKNIIWYFINETNLKIKLWEYQILWPRYCHKIWISSSDFVDNFVLKKNIWTSKNMQKSNTPIYLSKIPTYCLQSRREEQFKIGPNRAYLLFV